jgi:hypothetical protein
MVKVAVALQPKIPEVYQDLREVFSKTRTTCLPPHRRWDCAINLLAGSAPQCRRIYLLSAAETEAICTSTSPAMAGLFFMAKKDGGLRPCIDYRGINEISTKYWYPLTLVPAAIKQLRGAQFFTKLDLRSAYNLIREWKTTFSMMSGHYVYLVMQFCLANTPSVFQAFVK